MVSVSWYDGRDSIQWFCVTVLRQVNIKTIGIACFSHEPFERARPGCLPRDFRCFSSSDVFDCSPIAPLLRLAVIKFLGLPFLAFMVIMCCCARLRILQHFPVGGEFNVLECVMVCKQAGEKLLPEVVIWWIFRRIEQSDEFFMVISLWDEWAATVWIDWN